MGKRSLEFWERSGKARKFIGPFSGIRQTSKDSWAMNVGVPGAGTSWNMSTDSVELLRPQDRPDDIRAGRARSRTRDRF